MATTTTTRKAFNLAAENARRWLKQIEDDLEMYAVNAHHGGVQQDDVEAMRGLEADLRSVALNLRGVDDGEEGK